MPISLFLQNLLQDLLNLSQVIDVNGIGDIEKNGFDLFLGRFNLPETGFDILLIIAPL